MKKITILFVCALAFAGMTRGQVIEDFEHIRLNMMLGGAEDNSEMRVVANPDPGEANASTHVVRFHRSQFGVSWGGFWSALPEPLDLSEYKYVYVDVWKPRISPVKFKIEGGNSADLEIESMYPQTKVEEWETLVFDFSEKDGNWNVIALMPDFADPVDLEEDIVIFFDNIRVGGPPEEVPGGSEVDFVWVDFETSGFTNVDGFRDPAAGTVATDLEGLGMDEGKVVKLEYEVSETLESTGYRMWAFPTADVSAYNELVLRIRAEEPITDARIILRDHNAVEGGLGSSFIYFDIGEEWEELVFPAGEFELAEDEVHPDLSILQLIYLLFEYDKTSPESGTVYLDLVGFNHSEEKILESESGYMVENFEHIVLNLMLGSEQDNSSMEVVPNPDPDDVNPGMHVLEFHRSMHGVTWGGFWSALEVPVDLSDNKYVYVDVWKPRISPVKFKVEGGNSPDLEIESMYPQTKVEEWETLVFDFSEKDGTWNVIAFMPDFADPVDLEEDIVIFFDNIRLGSAPDEEPGEDPDFEEVDFVWVDFETSGFTNVEGFRDPSAGTTAEDVAGLGVEGGTVVKLDYTVSEGTTVTGYRMWAFPTADVSAYDQLVLHIRAEEAVSNARITLRDHNAIEGGLGTSFAYIDIGTEWQQIILPIEELELAEGEERPDLSILQLVLLSFEYDVADPEEGTVYIDLVGFIGEESTVSVPDTPLGQALDFELYPNPAMETVTVQAAEGSRVRVLDMQGNLVSQWDANGEAHRLDVAHLARGIYIIQVVNKQSIEARKLILQ